MAMLLSDISHKPGYRGYMQAYTRLTADGFTVEPTRKQGSAMLTSTVGANSLLVIPEESTGLHAGEHAGVLLSPQIGILP
jgi:molybdopterin biosynthesis enzyme